MNNIDNLKNVQEKVFRWCEANPLSTKMLVAWILSDMFAVSHTLVVHWMSGCGTVWGRVVISARECSLRF